MIGAEILNSPLSMRVRVTFVTRNTKEIVTESACTDLWRRHNADDADGHPLRIRRNGGVRMTRCVCVRWRNLIDQGRIKLEPSFGKRKSDDQFSTTHLGCAIMRVLPRLDPEVSLWQMALLLVSMKQNCGAWRMRSGTTWTLRSISTSFSALSS